MKKKELTQLSKEETNLKINELRKELMISNAQIATGTAPKNPGQVRQLKRKIAVLLTNRRKQEKA